MKFSIDYSITGKVWASAGFRQGGDSCEMIASYVHDTLEELTGAATQLCKGSDDARVVFMNEPGEHQAHISRQGEKLTIEVRWFEDWASWNIGPSDYKVVAKFATTVVRFRHQVLNVLNNLYVELGLEQYHKEWVEHEFPMRQYELLSAADNKSPNSTAAATPPSSDAPIRRAG